MNEGTIRVIQVKSGMHAKPKTRGTLRALGLGRIGKSNTLPDRKEIRGMIARVPHLVEVQEAQTATVTGKKPNRPEAAPAASKAEGTNESTS